MTKKKASFWTKFAVSMALSVAGMGLILYLFPAIYGRSNAGTFFLIALTITTFFNFTTLYIKNGRSTK